VRKLLQQKSIMSKKKFTLIVLTIVGLVIASALCKMRYSYPFQQFFDWKHCYGEATDEELVVHNAAVTLVPTIHKNTPGVKLSVLMQNTTYLNLEDLMYKFELWYETSGAKIQYKGIFSDLNVTSFSDESNTTLIEIEKPLHVEYDGNYEASIVLFYYRNITGSVPLRREMDEKLCVDVKFRFIFDRENVSLWNKGVHENKEQKQVVESNSSEQKPKDEF